MPKTLQGICANPPAQECIKLQKDFPFPLFSLYKVLSESFQDLCIYILKLLQKNFTFFVNKAKTFHWICRMHQTPKGLKTFQFSIHKKYQKCSWIYVGFRRQLNQKFENRKMKVGKSKMWKVRVGLIAAKWHLQSFVLMKLGGKPQKESQIKRIPGTWSRYLKCKTILIFKYPSIPVSNYKKSNKKNSFIEYFPNSNNRLEVSSFVRANLCFPGHEDSLGLQWGWCSEGDFVRSLIRSWVERRDLKCEKRPDHPGLSPAPIFQILLHATLNAGMNMGLEIDKPKFVCHFSNQVLPLWKVHILLQCWTFALPSFSFREAIVRNRRRRPASYARFPEWLRYKAHHFHSCSMEPFSCFSLASWDVSMDVLPFTHKLHHHLKMTQWTYLEMTFAVR